MERYVSHIHHWNRARKWNLFKERCLGAPGTTILDVGFSAKKEIRSYENSLERSIDDIRRVTALTIEPIPDVNPYPGLKIVRYNGANFPFTDGEFDVCWSNAVIEHVGDDTAKRLFLSEIARVSRMAFVTTPNRHFPIEPHTRVPLLHYLPKSVFDRVLIRVGKEWATGQYMDLMGERRFRAILEGTGIVDYELHRNRIGPFTMDFVAIFDNNSG